MPALLVLVLIFIILLIFVSCIRIVPQAQAMVVERLGAYLETWNVGVHFKMPFIDRVAKRVLLKEQVVDFAPQPVITKDNVTRSRIRSSTLTALRIRSWRSRT